MNNDQTTKVTSVKQVLSSIVGPECLVIIYGKGIGRKFELFDDVLTIGRDPENGIVLESESVSRRHCRLERYKGARYIIDLNSTNGTFVNNVAVTRAKIESGARIQVGDMIFKYLTGDDVETAYFEEVHKLAVTDGLTQIPNKRALDEFLEREVARARRYNRSLALLMIDIDHFKRINDTHGHLTGDVILRELAALISQRVRKEEMFARYGGEEFAIVLPETDRNGALQLAEALRKLVENAQFVFEGLVLKITISIGIGIFRKDEHQTVQDLIKLADSNLYIAKNKGRNRVYG